MHDLTAMRTEGIAEQLRLHPQVTAKADEGCRGLANDFPDQVQAPPRKPNKEAPLGERYAWREARRRQSSARICVEHTIGEEKKWRPLQRYPGRRESYAETHAAMPGWSPTAPPAGPPGGARALNSCSPAGPPADHPPAGQPSQHAPTSIAYRVVTRRTG
ncbi:hypothetical protein ACVWXU_000573 [Streptomyces sp. TE33382]